MKILIVGRGGREHALAWKSKQSPLVSEVFIAPGNVGMLDSGTLVNINDDDIYSLADFAEKEQIDLTIVGPEHTLALGITDLFHQRNLKIFAPTQAAARIESSKDFAKKIMEKYHIPTGQYQTFSSYQEAVEYVNTQQLPIVIKEDGLKAGKGVTVAFSQAEVMSALESAFSIPNKVVIEEYLDGFEFSIIALAHGEKIIPLEIAQDHKRVFDGDQGPNTGGMGVYSPVDKISSKTIEDTIEQILKPMLRAMKQESIPFTGFLFGGIMLTESGVKTIEFNARFGDPEAEGILPRLESDLIQVILDLLEGKESVLQWDQQYTVAVVLASENYPYSATLGAEIIIPETLDSLLFHMGTIKENDILRTNGGRVLSVVSKGNSVEEAKNNAYADLEKIKCDKLFCRKDIGAKA